MSVYLIVNAAVTNADSLTEYLSAVGETLENRDVDVLVSTRAAETIEGEPVGPRVVVMRFPDRDTFREWYDSEEYAPLKQLRSEASDTELVVVEGL